ncbi:hypothetical protein [Pontibaca salina]|uniref:Uncharacterized protein n=1 Tax=Pontibaca salina TaxID=2795731 RepID=A0A934HVG0_9RHOB|nr:hypothetical protein [Pontibaca salina]MBI6630998.1 hypothetical protein [Pontibaca salina]
MFDYTYHPPTPFHLFVEENSEGLQYAALLLGGRPYLRRTQRLIDDLRRQPKLTRSVKYEVTVLQELLTLEHVHDDERPEAAYFALLDPAMPYVEEICALADGLIRALVESKALGANMGQTSLSGANGTEGGWA